MVRVMVRVKDKNKVENLERYGTIIYKSPILNLITLDIKDVYVKNLKNDDNVISFELEPEGRLMPV